MSDKLKVAIDLAQKGDVDKAWVLLKPHLMDDPLDVPCLVLAAYIMRKAEHLPEAYHFALTASRLAPEDPAVWVNLGHTASELWRPEEAEGCYNRALKCKKIEPSVKRNVLLNISALYIDNGRYREALPIAQKLADEDPSDEQALANVGFCQLAARDWAGWKNYRFCLGSDWRPRVNYSGEPEWHGSSGMTVALYGEQGIGDEISFASMLPDAITFCKKVIVECDPRLQGLFRRSFPAAKVYGTRRHKSHAKWEKEDWQIDASLALGQIGEYYRTSTDDFPGTPYLLPCPKRTAMWKAYFEAKKKPIIGVAWRGGMPRTNARNRQLSLDDLLPVFTSVEAHYVSLQYKDASKEVDAFRKRHPEVDIEQYAWGTLTEDYDDTAALVASCDYVLCMQTAVAHTAGALGVPVTVLLPKATQWRYGNSEDGVPWYSCLKVIRQKGTTWRGEIERAARELKAFLCRTPGRAGAFTRPLPVRNGLDRVCPSDYSDSQYDGGHTSP